MRSDASHCNSTQQNFDVNLLGDFFFSSSSDSEAGKIKSIVSVSNADALSH